MIVKVWDFPPIVKVMVVVCLVTRDKLLPGIPTPEVKLVLTGGAAKLAGFEAMLKKILTPNVRIGSPLPLPGMLEELRQPAFATSVGILVWAAEQKSKDGTKSANGNGASHTEREPVGSGAGVSKILNPFKWGSR